MLTTDADTSPTAAVRLDAGRLRTIRLGMGLSQTEFAALVRRAGDDLGEPNACSKRLVQKWEGGDHRDCRPSYGRALAKATGLPQTRFSIPVAETDHMLASVDTEARLAALDRVIQELIEFRTQLGSGRG